MGYMVHVCTLYKVSYGEGTFNHYSENLNAFLKGIVFKDNVGQEQSLVTYSDAEETVLELSREGLMTLIEQLKDSDDYSVDISGSFQGYYTREELVRIFQSWMSDSDKDNDYIRLEWF